MEPDRYQKLHLLYLLGILCLLLGFSLLFISLYIIPYLLDYLHYDVPEAVIISMNYFEEDLFYSHSASKLITWLIILIPSLLALTVSYFISNFIDKEILSPDLEVPNAEEVKVVETIKRRGYGESSVFALKVFALMVAGIIILLLLAELVRISLL